MSGAVTLERLERGRTYLPILERLNSEIDKRKRDDELLAMAHRIAAGQDG